MGSIAHTFVIFFAGFLLVLPATSGAETTGTEYKHTVFTIDNNPDLKKMASYIRKEVQGNDHIAKIILDSKQNTLFIIHHKSLGVNELETFITNIGLSAKAVGQYNYQPAHKPVLFLHPYSNLRTDKTCGATKEAWKKLLQKYFH